jgi:hypothetical protein
MTHPFTGRAIIVTGVSEHRRLRRIAGRPSAAMREISSRKMFASFCKLVY